LGEPRYLEAATAAGYFVLGDLRDDEGRLLRTWKAGEGKLLGYLEDHAFLLEALITLYEATFEPVWFVEATKIADQAAKRFADPEKGGFFETASDAEQLVARRKDLEDHPIPAGNSSMAYGLLRLAALTGEHSYEQQALGVLALVGHLGAKHPQAFAHLLQAIDFHLSPTREVALAGADTRELARVIREEFRPHIVLAGTGGDGVLPMPPLMEGRGPVEGRAAAYVCEGFACKAPTTEPAELQALLAER
ncbi:MAG: thioredoxin domain-containing protein, partial [Thermoleophilaceae bacterium]|nr:thioredoxin domain-containing protein [Thermoleophilaceae bacterium]